MTDDRAEMKAARAAGKALHHEQRLETREALRLRTRREVAEEIAAEVEEYSGHEPLRWRVVAARIAREIGARP